MPEEKKRSGVKVCGWLSDEVFSKLVEKGYKSHTIIVRHGAELIIGQPIGEHGEFLPRTLKGTEENTGEQRKQMTQIGEQRERGEPVQGVINVAEKNTKESMENTGELRAHVREQREHVETLKNHNETLKAELEKAGREKEAIQNLYNNYMLQMQTLINHKVIEAPGAKKSWWRFW